MKQPPRTACPEPSLEPDAFVQELALLVQGPPTAEERSAARLDESRWAYFRRENESESFCGVLQAYRSLESEDCKAPPESGGPGTALIHMLQRDSLEDARRRHGLDGLRARLIDALVDAASFEAGLGFLCRHAARRGVVPATAFPGERWPEAAGSIEQKLVKAAGLYPDMTADEVCFCALLADADRPLMADGTAMLFHPVSLVGMDTDGLLFSDCSTRERDVDTIIAVAPHQVGGITGVDYETRHFPFRPEIAQAVKALVMLRVRGTDLFSKLFKEEQTASLLRGDAMLCKELLMRRRVDTGTGRSEPNLDELISACSHGRDHEQLKDEVRGEVAGYLSKCVLRDHLGSRYSIPEITRLFGLLTRLPGFVFDGEAFSGYALYYGRNLEFLRDDGTRADAVPLAAYLQARLTDDLHDRAVSFDRTDKVLPELFSYVRDRVIERSIRAGHRMPLDVLQERLLCGLDMLFPIHVQTRIKEMSSFAELHMSRGTSGKRLERSLKFGLSELCALQKVLAGMPKAFLRGVRVVTKSVWDRLEFDVFVQRQAILGKYHPKARRIEIRVPLDTLIPESELEAFLHYLHPSPEGEGMRRARARLEVDLDTHYLLHVFLHELGESVVATFPPELLASWGRLFPVGKYVPPGQRRRHFVSLYSTVDPKEDFCETFAVYVLYGAELRRRSLQAPVLRSKYELMEALFAHDGIPRTFPDMFSHPMELLLHSPGASWEDVDRAALLRELEEERQFLEREERRSFSKEAMSHSDVEEIIEQHEEVGKAISAEEATRILEHRLRASAAEDGESSSWRRYRIASWKAAELLLRAGASACAIDLGVEETFSSIMDRPRKEALEHLKELGVKRGRTALFERLSGLFKCFESSLRSHFAASAKRDSLTSASENARILAALCKAVERETLD
ncbi:MAG: hypothetical protein HY721_09750 [Planctomycetes bacterium]|nr:hypothetical protein [Planctomycetota bacterium]